MKTNSFVRLWVLAAISVLGTCLFASNAHAQWGSIRASNREHREGGNERRGEAARGGRGGGGGEARREVRPSAPVRREGEHHEEVRRVMPERPHWDWDADRREGYYWSGYHSGMRLNVLPRGYVSLSLRGHPYYYYQGVYYDNGPSGYVVVSPPMGALVPALPPGAQGVAINGAVYYYAAGAFYLPQPGGFMVVPPPLGVTVTALPPGAVPVIVNGVLYYTADSVYYLPVIQNGITMYTVVQP